MTSAPASRAVAFFDLDHGVLRTPAPKLACEHLVSPGRDLARFIQRVAGVLAGPLPGPVVGRALESAMAGTEVKALELAAAKASEEAELLPHACVLMEEHRQAGRRRIAVTQIPEKCARPIARALGFDDVVATKFRVSNGELDGSIDGPFVWGRGKLDALRGWASSNNASLRRSWLYAGAFSDAASLAEIGNPVVCDPEPRLAGVAWLKGWPTRSLSSPPGVTRLAGRELQDLLRPFSRPELVPNAQIEIHGLDKIPSSGGAIVCGNHRSYYDAIAVGLAISRSGRTARFLGKKEVFDVPVAGMVARWAGGIRVERGTGSDEPLQAAEAALRAGELICLMPEGTIPRGPAFFEPELRGRWGAARLASATKAPVIPVGLWGTEKVWPRSSRIPNLNPLNRPKVTITVGDPVPLTYGDPDTDTKAIMTAIVDLLPEEAKVRRDPTPEELARTYPAGYKGDPERELDRRPGAD
jgi:putative phosphoserine phosphatase / 1-acylglycerol-3-phosphate O-acyltransferase